MTKNTGLLGLQVDFFLPVWRRVAVVLVCAVWSLVEFVTAAPFWGVIFGAIAVLTLWQFFFDGWPEASEPVSPEPESRAPE